MATYISLCNWTQQGIEKIKESPARLDAARKAFKAAGADLKQFYMTMGRYDFVVFTEAPEKFDPRDYLKPAREAMKKVVALRMTQFGQAGHAGDYSPLPLELMKQRYAAEGAVVTR